MKLFKLFENVTAHLVAAGAVASPPAAVASEVEVVGHTDSIERSNEPIFGPKQSVCKVPVTRMDSVASRKEHNIDVEWFSCDICEYKCERRALLKSHLAYKHNI